MYLKQIQITNYRCFKKYEMNFAPGITVLFGKNGAGKTTLIHALHKALSFMMYSDNVTEVVNVKGKRKRKLLMLRPSQTIIPIFIQKVLLKETLTTMKINS